MSAETDEAIEATALCPGCMRPVEGEPDYCPYCNSPLGLVTSIDPYRRALSLGYLYRHAARRPNSKLIVIGMAAFLGSTLLGGIALFGFSITSIKTGSSLDLVGEGVIGLLFATIGAVGLYKTFRNYGRLQYRGAHESDPDENPDSD